eukprot:640472-Amphidinium_carterae.1
MMQRWANSELVETEVCSDTCLKGCVAKDWSPDGLILKGTTIDLEAAFRQLPLSRASAAASALCYYSTEANAPRFICMTALPFGSVASVAYFLRYARAVWALGVKLLWASWASFFDDYMLLEFGGLQENVLESILLMLKILGIPVATDKLHSLSDSFIALGVQINLLCGPEPGIALVSKPGRIDEIMQLKKEVTRSTSVSREELQRLRGKLGFMTGWLASRLAALAAGQIQFGGCQVGGRS